jgi:Lrp/AsnC family transcriptional regulator, regulator for asnA, asnC and gidA
MDLNKKDCAILYELDKNSRIPISKLAKKLNLSRDIISYRIKQLEKKKIIRGYHALIDPSRLGLQMHRFYFNLFAMDSETFEKLIFKLVKKKNTFWIAETDGFTDLIFALLTKDEKEVHKFYKTIKEEFGKYIKKDLVSRATSYSYLNKNYLTNSKELREEIKIGNSSKIKFDKIDLEIIDELSKDARTPLIKIAKKLKMDSSAIIYRIKQLEKKEIIKAYKLELNHLKLKRDFYTIKFILSEPTAKNINKLKVYTLLNPNVTNTTESLARFDFELDMEVEDSQQYYEFIRDLKDKFDFIAEIKFYRAIRNFKTININQLPLEIQT